MTEVLQHAKAITQHRDHALVDTALVYSLIDQLGQGRKQYVIRLYRIETHDNKFHITLTAWNENKSVRFDEYECDPAAAPKQLIQALTLHVTTSAALSTSKRRKMHYCWLPVMHDKTLLACIEVGLSSPLNHRQMTLIDGMRGLYANYLSLLHYSEVDTLTRLLNRKTFDDSLHKLLAATNAKSLLKKDSERRIEKCVDAEGDWLAIIDIDHFKRINDRFGHLFGDEVLILIANIMRQTFRKRDKLFRFGGEEFVVLLRQTTQQNALGVFERFRERVAAHPFPQLGNVTISLGITHVYPFDNPPTLIGRADEALYHAKSHGRNQ
ncbi:MAG: GGDEF domain-containing protein, partial [Sterolibacterium sp.]